MLLLYFLTEIVNCFKKKTKMLYKVFRCLHEYQSFIMQILEVNL